LSRQLIHNYLAIQLTLDATGRQRLTRLQTEEQGAILGLIVGRATDAFGVLGEHNAGGS
jgi:hypothetical protein